VFEITEEDIEKLTYSRNVFQETLRIYSVIPHCTRIATKDVKLEKSGLFIPKGQEILVPFCLLSRDTDEWGQNITSFEPDRFEGMNRNIASKGYLPFGYGSRACIGGNLAMTEGTIILALLVQKWKFSEDKDFNMKINSGISMVSENGVKVILEPEDRWDTIETLNVVTSEGA
jgi:cytochrome P450